MDILNKRIDCIKGIGEKKALAFNKLGVFSLYDLISFFPARYEDRTQTKEIKDTFCGEPVCVKAYVADEPRLSRIRRGMELVKFRICDDTGSIDVTYFNQSYVKNQLKAGDCGTFFGKIDVLGFKRTMANPVFEKENSGRKVTGCVYPIYRTKSGLTQRDISAAIKFGLSLCRDELPDALPKKVRERCGLSAVRFAYENIHMPANFQALELARRRLVFEELFVLACALGKAREDGVRADGIKMSEYPLTDFWKTLPFSPTAAQLRATSEGVADMSSGMVMNRLVQGDVGSGKTLVAAALIWLTWKNGYMSALMAPTEILARQHFLTLSELFAGFGVKIELLTGSTPIKEKKRIAALLKDGQIDLIIGTHALFSEAVEYDKLGLVVTDEQHRFGVSQRSALIGKGKKPHVLVMSATPIPRTLALIIYGDLDVSIIDELPPGRQKVSTFLVDSSYRKRLEDFILRLADEGRQVFVVCPKVEENEDEPPSKRKSAEEYAKELSAKYPTLKVGCVHGRMKTKDKEETMAGFADGSINVLVSTTVIEVGVDVPNAALIVVENAECFGLSQLHQLRGRVGRGTAKSWCILVSDSDTDEAKARLKTMCMTNDGFKIAEEDLRLRGPGDFFGARQHGLPEMRAADLGTDMNVLTRAQKEAESVLKDDPQLAKPENKELNVAVQRLFSRGEGSFN